MTTENLNTAIPLPYATAQAAYAAFSNGAAGPHNDPARYAAMVFANAGNGIAQTLKNMLAAVTATTTQTEQLNNYVKMINDGLAFKNSFNDPVSGGTNYYDFVYGTQADMNKLQADMTAAGIKNVNVRAAVESNHAGEYAIYMQGVDLDNASSNLRVSLDSLSTKMQSQNLSVQRQMTLYDTFFQGVSGAVEQQAKLNKTPTTNIAE